MPAVAAKKISTQEKSELIKELIGKKYDISGKNFAVLSKVIDYIGNVDSAITIAELLPKLGTLLVGSRFFSVLGSGASILSIFLFPIDGNERKLCALLLNGFEQKLDSIEKLTWKANYSILYPN